MNKSFFKNILLIICLGLLVTSCSKYRRESSDKFVEKLNSQIKSGNFEQIYDEASNASKDRTSKEEFLESMKAVINEMRQVDESLAWEKDEKVLLSNGEVSTELYFVYRKIEKNGKKLDVTITVVNGILMPEFYDLCVSPSESKTVEFQKCVTNALRKI